MSNILFFNLLLSFIIFSLLFYCYFEIAKIHKGEKGTNPFLIISIILVLIWYLFRLLTTGIYPFVSLFETLIFFSSLILVNLLLIKYINPYIKTLLFLIPAFLYFIALILPLKFKIISPLALSLKSFWIIIHVPSFFLGYTSLFLSFIISIRFLFLTQQQKKINCKIKTNNNFNFTPIKNLTYFNYQTKIKEEILNIKKFLNIEIYKSFIFITIGLITGSLWADFTWQSFWNFDPKETSALILWFLISFYFHFKNYKIKSIIVIISFLALIFTYIGISYLFSGLHSYI